MKTYMGLEQDDWNVVLKCIKAAVGVEPLKDCMRKDACRIYDTINTKWHDQAQELIDSGVMGV